MDMLFGMRRHISIKMKFDPDIFDAVEFGDLDSVQMYWTGETDVNCQDTLGMTLLMYASVYGWPEIIDYLLKYKPDITLRDKKGETAIDKSYNEDIRIRLLRYSEEMK